MTRIISYLFLFLFILFAQQGYSQRTEPIEIVDHSLPDDDEHETEERNLDLLKILKTAKLKNTRTQSSPVLKTFIEKGPTNYPGRINSVLVDNINGIYLAGTSTGGLWRFEPDRTVLSQSQTNNTKWYKVNDFELSLSVVKIVQSPVDHNTIYYATGDGSVISGAGIFKSTNGGTSFSQLTATDPTVNADFKKIYAMEIHPVTHDIYVGLLGKVYVSKDGGTSFQLVFNLSGSGSISSIAFNASGAVLISVDNLGVYRSPDGSNNSFVQLTNGIKNTSLPSSGPYYYVKIAGCESQRDVVYALVSGTSSVTYLDGIYKTIDGGNSWIKVNDPKSTVNYSMPYHAFVISVKPSDPNTLITAGVTAASSSDGGTTWKYIMNIGIDHASVVWEKNSSSVYFTCDHGMYFHLSDAVMDTYGNRADVVSDGMNDLQCYYGDYFTAGNGVVYGAQDNQSCVIRNNSSLAYYYSGGDGFNVFTHKQDSNVVYGSLQYGLLYRCDSISPKAWPSQYPKNTVSILGSTLDANNDGNVDEGHQFYTQFLVSNTNSDNLFFPTNQKIYRSKNRGASWTALSGTMSLNGCVLAYDEQATPNLYMGVQNKIYRVNNALNTGLVVPDELAIGLGFVEWAGKMEVDPNDYTKLYMAVEYINGLGASPYLYRIDNANGASPAKTNVSGDMPTFINDFAIYPGNSNIIFAGTDIGLFYTLNGGTHWTFVQEFPYVKVNDIKFRPSDNKLYIFTYGRGTWIAELDPLIITASEDPEAVTTSSVKVYPSPSDDYIRIKTDNTMATEVYVLDLNGRIMLHEEKYQNESALSIHHFASGIYIVKYKTAQGWKYETIVKK